MSQPAFRRRLGAKQFAKRFNVPAAEEAWHRVLSWFGEHVD